jgi:hypothetical protein
MPRLHHDDGACAPDPRLEAALRRLLLGGALLVLCLPAAREANVWLGAWPLWLLGMPAASWWALHRFPLPRWQAATPRHAAVGRRRRQGTAQARRRARPAPRVARVA